ncbi:NAD-dependent epimerase/dehydratase family protein [Halorussus caseinilyticus]|uniref:NAD-dependent epimerase/dehydratase family protein n=1 Tax=Halorussus caseinilyticus TaxID=3034025 RepID=A0ABD5WV07_9EURY|nr:GDP-mannose 4,6-dehydratase [Halorussus sp. DT72]
MSFWRDETVLVTGAAGFVGAHLASDLESRGATVVATDIDTVPAERDLNTESDRLDFEILDVRDRESIESLFADYDFDLVYHLAAESLVGDAKADPTRAFSTNVEGTWNVLDVVRESEGVSDGVVVASSDKAYGPMENPPYTEDTALTPDAPYSVSKMAADRIARTYHTSYDVPVTVTRCSNIYGPGDLNFSRIVPGTIRKYLDDEAPVIRSDGSPTRDYLYIDDAVSAYRTLGRQNRSVAGEAFNFGTGTGTSVLELVSLVGDVMGKDDLEPVVKGTAEGHITHQRVDAEKAEQSLDWRPETSLEDGLGRTAQWYEDRLE